MAALDCIEEAKFDDEAQKVFKTEAVQDSLQSAMNTIISALELISRYYSKARGRESLVTRHATLFYFLLSTRCGPDHRRS